MPAELPMGRPTPGELLPGSGHRPAVEVVMAELGDDASALGAALRTLSPDR